MKLKPDQLSGHLAKDLKAVYVLASNEPLLLQEASEQIRHTATKQGYTSREVVAADARSDWEKLFVDAAEPSLFAERRILDLKLMTGKPGVGGSKALSEYAAAPVEDLLLIVSVGSLESRIRSSKWYKSLEKVGACIELWPPRPDELAGWVEQRMRKAGLKPETQAADVLAERIEGNLLAAQQEIDKLALLYPGESMSADRVDAAVADNARFDVYAIVDEALAGRADRVVRVLQSLRAEGAPTALVLWALSQDLEKLAHISWECEQGKGNVESIVARQRIWPAKRHLFQNAIPRRSARGWRSLLQRCARIDKVIKGLSTGDPWLELERLALATAGGTR
ncbi:MAG: DNA polymerase III subunit delta [Gammaproteobacteria bacterium]|nr:MAG: DNA polymerase III subunit delta [Gammaproteobacteria bacterium]